MSHLKNSCLQVIVYCYCLPQILLGDGHKRNNCTRLIIPKNILYPFWGHLDKVTKKILDWMNRIVPFYNTYVLSSPNKLNYKKNYLFEIVSDLPCTSLHSIKQLFPLCLSLSLCMLRSFKVCNGFWCFFLIDKVIKEEGLHV